MAEVKDYLVVQIRDEEGHLLDQIYVGNESYARGIMSSNIIDAIEARYPVHTSGEDAVAYMDEKFGVKAS